MSTYTIWVNIEHQDECHEEHDEGLPDKLGVFTSLDEAAAHLRRLTGWNDPFLCNERDSDFRLDDDEEERPVTPYLAGRLEEEEETNEQLRAEIKVLKELLDLEHLASAQAREDAASISRGWCQQHDEFPAPFSRPDSSVRCYGETFRCSSCERRVCTGFGTDDCLGVKCNTCWAECKKVSCCCPPPLPAPHRGRSPE